MKGKKKSQEEIDQTRKLLDEGLSVATIAQRLRVSRSFVKRIRAASMPPPEEDQESPEN